MELSSSLGDKLACLRETAQAPREKRAWIPDAIHTLIMAALARIFGRLEQLLLLWQSGQLPLPQSANPRPTAAPLPTIAITPHHPAHPRARRTPHPAAIHDLAARIAIPRRAPFPCAPHPAPNRASPRTTTPSARPRPAHDPPAARHAICR